MRSRDPGANPSQECDRPKCRSLRACERRRNIRVVVLWMVRLRCSLWKSVSQLTCRGAWAPSPASVFPAVEAYPANSRCTAEESIQSGIGDPPGSCSIRRSDSKFRLRSLILTAAAADLVRNTSAVDRAAVDASSCLHRRVEIAANRT